MTWFMLYLRVFNIDKGPIFQTDAGRALKEATWIRRTDKLFKAAGLYTPANTALGIDKSGCTNHSIRKSACQWAGRCCANPLDVKNNGRWISYDEMAEYYAQGSVRRSRLTEGGGVDPIWRMWVWKPVASPGEDGRSQL